MPTLVMSINGTQVSTYVLEKQKISLGRDSSNDIRIDDPAVSSCHAVLTRVNHDQDSTYHIIDNNSTNGTFVNEEPITSLRLSDGDQINIGMTLLTYWQAKENDLGKTKKIHKSWIPGIYYLKD